MTLSLADDRQLSLFSKTPLNPIPELKRFMRFVIKECGLSRPEVADKMTELADIEGMGREINLDTLNSWMKNEDNRHIPIELLVIFCKVTDSILPILAFLIPLGASAVKDKERTALELGQAMMALKKAAQQKRMAMLKLEMEK